MGKYKPKDKIILVHQDLGQFKRRRTDDIGNTQKVTTQYWNIDRQSSYSVKQIILDYEKFPKEV